MRRMLSFLAVALLLGLAGNLQADPPVETRWVGPGSGSDCLAPPVRLGASVFPSGNGLEVDTVQPGSAAARLGLESGDRILEVNGRPVRSPSELQQSLRDAVSWHNGHIRVLVENIRGRLGIPGERLYVNVRTSLTVAPDFPSDSVPVYRSSRAGLPY